MLYDPQNELSDEQMKELSEDDFFAYLDAKAAHLKKSTVPLDSYHIKRFTAISNNGMVSDEDMKRAKKLGMESEFVKAEKIKEAAKTIKVKKPDLNVKGHKTNRRQWID
jgi:phage baseplate assembly protein gpV